MKRDRPRYMGIDFSGNQARWRSNDRDSNIWIAEVEEGEGALHLVNLLRVQQLPGEGRPFARLTTWLRNGGFSAAALDAPFSIPWWFFGTAPANHSGLLALVNQLDLADRQDFPTGRMFRDTIAANVPFAFSKPLRVTEAYWRGRGVNVRSTVWTGTRPGAPFTSACLKLLAGTGRPVWPWMAEEESLLVEAFPAAQLLQWGLPFVEYNGDGGHDKRTEIITDLIENRRLQTDDAWRETLNANADALDAVLSAFAARAVFLGELAVELPPFDVWKVEGWIAVHR